MVSALLAECGMGGTDTTAQAVLLTSEIATNAYQHANHDERGERRFRLNVVIDNDIIRVEVHDPDKAAPKLGNGGLTAEQGRGLPLVAALAKEWGARPEADGKTVWFMLDRAGGDT